MSERAHRSSSDSTSTSIEYFDVIPSVCAHVIRIHLTQHVYAAIFQKSEQLTLPGLHCLSLSHFLPFPIPD